MIPNTFEAKLIQPLIKKQVEKGVVTMQDRFELDIYIWKTIHQYFKTPISENEKLNVMQIEIDNLVAFNYTCFHILNSTNPIEEYVNDKYWSFFETKFKENNLDANTKKRIEFINTIQYVMCNGYTNNQRQPYIIGKIPRSGIFCNRQTQANNWYNDYYNFQLDVLRHILTYSNNNIELGHMYLATNTSYYFLKYYPQFFNYQDDDLNKILYNISIELFNKSSIKKFVTQ